MQTKFKAKRVETNTWVEGCLIYREPTVVNNKLYAAIIIFDTGLESTYNAYLELEVYPESICRVIKYNNKEYKEFDYNKDGEMLIFCNDCMSWQFAQIDIPTKDIVINCHNCEGNFMFHDAINNFEAIGNLND
jgi:hypothetical protein